MWPAPVIAMQGRKVLLVDLDPQSHSTIVLGNGHDSFPATIQDVFMKRVAIRDVIVKTNIDNLYPILIINRRRLSGSAPVI